MVRVNRALFPASRCLFMYREVLSVAKSVYRLSLTDPVHIFWIVGRLSGPMTMMIGEPLGTLCSRVRRLDSDLTIGVLTWAAATKAYLDARRRGFDISALRYEDVVARPLDMCRVILEFCRLPCPCRWPSSPSKPWTSTRRETPSQPSRKSDISRSRS